MKKFSQYLLAAAAIVAASVLCFTVAPVLATSAVAAACVKIGVVALLAANLIPYCSQKMGIITTSVVTNTIQPLYSKKLLDHAVPMTSLVDYAQLEELPANSGSTSIRFYRPPAADLTATGAPSVLTEGTPLATDRDLSFTPIDVTLVQIGQKGRVTDVATNVGLLKFLDSIITLYGEEFALDVDTRLRNLLVHQTTGFTKQYAQGAANFAALAAASLATSVLQPRDFLDAMTRLKIARAPKINGHYVAIVPPQGSRDIMNNAEFREVVRQNYADKIFKGEVGDYFGLRIVEGTNPFTEDETEGTLATTFSGAGSNTTGFIYSTIVTGKGGYGAVNMKKMGASPHKPQMIIVNGPDKADPLGQYTSVGWKAYWAGVVLNSAWGITLRHKTQFV